MNAVLRKPRGGRLFEIAVALPLCAALAALRPGAAHAEEHEVRTLGARFAPLVLFLKPGDSVIWRGMADHEAQLIEGMGPPGVTVWGSTLGEEGFRVTFEQEGAYVYKCHTHMNAGMVGAIVVGDGEPGNLAAIDAALADVGTGRAFVQGVVARMKRELQRRQGR